MNNSICLAGIVTNSYKSKILDSLETTVKLIDNYIIFNRTGDNLITEKIKIFFNKNNITGSVIDNVDENLTINKIRQEILKISIKKKYIYTFFFEPYSLLKYRNDFMKDNVISKLKNNKYLVPHLENNCSIAIPCLFKNASIIDVNNFNLIFDLSNENKSGIIQDFYTKSFLNKNEINIKYKKYLETESCICNRILFSKIIDNFDEMFCNLDKYYNKNRNYSWEIYYFFAMYYFTIENYKLSLEWLRKIEKINRPEVYYLFSKIFYNNKQYSKSYQYLNVFFNKNKIDLLKDYTSKKLNNEHYLELFSDFNNIIFYLNFQVILIKIQEKNILKAVDKCYCILQNNVEKKKTKIIINFLKVKLKPIVNQYSSFNNINEINKDNILFTGKSILVNNKHLYINNSLDEKEYSNFLNSVKKKYKFFTNLINPIAINNNFFLSLGSFLDNKKIYNFVYSYKNKFFLSYPFILDLQKIISINYDNFYLYILGNNYDFKFVIYQLELKKLYLNFNLPFDIKKNIFIKINKKIKISVLTNNYQLNEIKYRNYEIINNSNEKDIKHQFVMDFNSFIFNYKNYLQKINEFIYLPNKINNVVPKEFEFCFYTNVDSSLIKLIKENLEMHINDKDYNNIYCKNLISPFCKLKNIFKSKYLFINNDDFQIMNLLDISKIIQSKTIIINLLDEKTIENKYFEHNFYIKNQLLNKFFLFNIAQNNSYQNYILQNIIHKNLYNKRIADFDKGLDLIYKNHNIFNYCFKQKNKFLKYHKLNFSNKESDEIYNSYIEKYNLKNNFYFNMVIKRIISKKYKDDIFFIYETEQSKNRMLNLSNNNLKINFLGKYHFININELNNNNKIINKLLTKKDNIYFTENLNLSLQIDQFLAKKSQIYIMSDNILYNIF
tara:strand:- start:1388 stop:4066 length:2679 start_codon:yes stop_codon:yes gene_type:complete